MALKDIFTMVKADKYTADGREELIKAQEAEVEDKVYQIGEISQKTGLQKTANGWVKPKSGGAGKGSSEVKSGSGTTLRAQKEESKPEEKKFTGSWENDKNNLTPTQLQGISRLAKTSNLSESEVYENVKELIIPKSEKQIAAEQKKIDKSIAKEKTKFKALEGSDINSFKKKMNQMGYQFSPKKKDGQIVGGSTWGTFGYNSVGKPEVDFDYSEEKGVHNIRFVDEVKDSAPRQLTGDCKISVRKSR